MPADLEVIDIPSAELHVTSSLAHTDLYVRVSDVAPSGAITHVSDALRRLAADQPIDGMVEVELAPVAHRFQRGHRIRVQVAGAAYPRWDRNLGTGEPPATASAMRAADQQVHHAPHRPSVLVERARVTRSTPSTARSSRRRPRLVTTIWQPGSALSSSRTC